MDAAANAPGAVPHSWYTAVLMSPLFTPHGTGTGRVQDSADSGEGRCAHLRHCEHRTEEGILLEESMGKLGVKIKPTPKRYGKAEAVIADAKHAQQYRWTETRQEVYTDGSTGQRRQWQQQD